MKMPERLAKLLEDWSHGFEASMKETLREAEPQAQEEIRAEIHAFKTAAAELREAWPEILTDIKCELLEEMSEEEMRGAMGDEGFERAAREAGEVIERALEEHRARETNFGADK